LALKLGNSAAEARAALEEAGFAGRAIKNNSGTASGTVHTVKELKMDVRVMDAGAK
jgi:hypothetical protein